MRKHALKGFALAGLLGLTGLAVGCTEREEAGVRDDARQVGQELDRTGESLENTGRDVEGGVREGIGGSGAQDDADIGDREGVINDGEGPFEQNNMRGDDNILREGEGPVEENTERQ
jgi:hypothetical protein